MKKTPNHLQLIPAAMGRPLALVLTIASGFISLCVARVLFTGAWSHPLPPMSWCLNAANIALALAVYSLASRSASIDEARDATQLGVVTHALCITCAALTLRLVLQAFAGTSMQAWLEDDFSRLVAGAAVTFILAGTLREYFEECRHVRRWEEEMANKPKLKVVGP